MLDKNPSEYTLNMRKTIFINKGGRMVIITNFFNLNIPIVSAEY